MPPKAKPKVTTTVEHVGNYKLQKTGLKIGGKPVLRMIAPNGSHTRDKIQKVANFLSKRLRHEGKTGRIQVLTFHKPKKGEKTLHDGWRSGVSVKLGQDANLFSVADYDHPGAKDPKAYNTFQITVYPA